MANFSKSFNFRNGVQVDDDKFIVKPTTGLVGISNTLPTETLDVVGNTKVTGVSSAANIFAGAAVTVGTGVSQISIDGVSGLITAVSYFGDGSTLTNIVAIATAGFTELSGTLSTTHSVGIGSTQPFDFKLDVIGDARIVGASTFVGLTTISGDLFATTLGVSGASVLKGGSIIENGATINQANVTGVSTFGSVVDINAGLDVDGQSDLDEVEVAGVSTFSALVDINNRLDVVGGANIDQLNVSGISTYGGVIDGNAGADISGGETVLSSATVSDLTDNRIVIAGTSGALEDSGNLTFTGTQFTVTGDVAIIGVSTLSDNLQVGSGGTVGFAKSLSMSDGAQINLGDQDDLVIEHTGTLSQILDRGTGGLKILSDNIEISNASGIGTALKVTLGEQLQIFENGGQKFNTTGAGVSVYDSLSLGQLNGGSLGLSTHTGELSYGTTGLNSGYSTRRTLNLINRDSGNLNYYLNAEDILFDGSDQTGNFNWLSGTSNSPMMTLTGIGGSLGVGVTNPARRFEVDGTSKFTGAILIDEDVQIGETVVARILKNTSTSQGITGIFSGAHYGDIIDERGFTILSKGTGAGNTSFTDSFFTGNIHTNAGISTVKRLRIGNPENTSGTLSVRSRALEEAVSGSDPVFTVNTKESPAAIQNRFRISKNGQVAIRNAGFTLGEAIGVDASAAYQIALPKITTTQRDNFSSTTAGAVIYNTSVNKIQFYNGSAWETVTSST